MKPHKIVVRSVLLVVFGYMFLLLPQQGVLAQEEGLEGMSVDQAFVLVEGKVRSVSLESSTITVKPKKSKKIEMVLDSQTTFEGASSLKDIKKPNRVKVWYILDGEDKKAVKIEKLPELGC